MEYFINKKNAEIKTPETSNKWKSLTKDNRTKIVNEILLKNQITFLELIETNDNGYLIFKLKKNIPAKKRGLILLDLELILKKNIDEALTIWLEPVGDKSKLRALRGIKVKSI